MLFSDGIGILQNQKSLSVGGLLPKILIRSWHSPEPKILISRWANLDWLLPTSSSPCINASKKISTHHGTITI